MPLLRPLLLTALTFGLLIPPALARGPAPDDAPSADMLAVRSLHRQIAATELLNALQLSPEQQASLRDIVSQVLDEQRRGQEERRTKAPELRAILERYLDDVQANGEPSAASAEALEAFGKSVRGDRGERQSTMKPLLDQLRGLLDEGQRQALIDFEPSLRLGPGPEERQQRRERRMEGARERGFEPRPEAMERQDQRRTHRKVRRIVRHLILSQELLDALR